jgi:hypothetical protein
MTETSWKALMQHATSAASLRQWAQLRRLVWDAAAAPDAPEPVDGPSREGRRWDRLYTQLLEHDTDVPEIARAVVRLLVRRAREQRGAGGAPDPTAEELCVWLLHEVEGLAPVRVEVIDDEVARDRAARAMRRGLASWATPQPWPPVLAGAERESDDA